MPGEKLGEAWVELRAKMDKFERELKEAGVVAGNTSKKMQSALGKVEKKNKGLIKSLFSLKGALAAVGATAAIMMAKKWVEASNRQEQAVQRLRALIKAQGGDYEALVPQIERVTAAYQKKTTYGDEVQMEAMAKLLGIVTDTQKAMQSWSLVMDLAAGTGMDLGTAAMYVGRAMEGQPEMLARYVPAIRNLTKEQRTWANVSKILQERFAGVAEEMAKTPAGKVEQMANAWGDFQEKLGDLIKIAIVPFLGKLLEGLNFILDNWSLVWKTAYEIIKETFAQIKKIVWGFFNNRSAFEAGINLIKEFGTSFVQIYERTLELVGRLIARVSSIIWAPLIKSLQWVGDNIKYYFELGIQKAREAIVKGLNTISSSFVKLANVFIDGINKMIEGAESFTNFFLSGISKLKSGWDALMKGIAWFAKNVLRIQIPDWLTSFEGDWEVSFNRIKKLSEDGLTFEIPETTLKQPKKFADRMDEAWEEIKEQYKSIPEDLQKYVDDLKGRWDKVTEAAGAFGTAVDWGDYTKKIAALIAKFKSGQMSVDDFKAKTEELKEKLEDDRKAVEEVTRSIQTMGREGVESVQNLIDKFQDVVSILEEIDAKFKTAVWGKEVSRQVSLLESVRKKYSVLKWTIDTLGKGQEEINKLIVASIPELHEAGMTVKGIVGFWESLGEKLPSDLKLANKELEKEIFLFKSGAKYVEDTDKFLVKMPGRYSDASKEIRRSIDALSKKEPAKILEKTEESIEGIGKKLTIATDTFKVMNEEVKEFVPNLAPLSEFKIKHKIDRSVILSPLEQAMQEAERRGLTSLYIEPIIKVAEPERFKKEMEVAFKKKPEIPVKIELPKKEEYIPDFEKVTREAEVHRKYMESIMHPIEIPIYPEKKIDKSVILTPLEEAMEGCGKLRQSYEELASPKALTFVRIAPELTVKLWENAKKPVLDTVKAIKTEIPKVAPEFAKQQKKALESSLSDMLLYYNHLVAMDKLTTEERIEALQKILETAKLTILDQWALEEEIHRLRKQAMKEEIEELIKQREKILSIQEGMTDAMTSAIMAGKGIIEAFRSAGEYLLNFFVKKVLQAVANKLWEIFGLQKLISSLVGGFFGLFGFAEGGVFAKKYAEGGVFIKKLQEGGTFPSIDYRTEGIVRRPTILPMAGEKRPEAFVPLKGGRIPVEIAGEVGNVVRIEAINIAFPNIRNVEQLYNMDRTKFNETIAKSIKDSVKKAVISGVEVNI